MSIKHFIQKLGYQNYSSFIEQVFASSQQLGDRLKNYDKQQRVVHGMEEKLKRDIEHIVKIKAFIDEPLILKNAVVGQRYQIDINSALITECQIYESSCQGEHLKSISANEVIFTQSGLQKMRFSFKTKMFKKRSFIKELTINVRACPKSLWKNTPSDSGDPFHKLDTEQMSGQIGEKFYIAASCRGRAHQHQGSFRDDHVAIQTFTNGWTLIVLADGAGSSLFARKGSQLACEQVIEQCSTPAFCESVAKIERELAALATQKADGLNTEVINLGKASLYQVVKNTHKSIIDFAQEYQGKHPQAFAHHSKGAHTFFHTTLIFTLFKKIRGLGYVFLNFSVGDCPMAIVADNKVTLLNRLDVGEFGGGTRFVTMPEIFHDPDIAQRFTLHLQQNFDYLFLMTDGIYDPKFEVEAHLEQDEKWQAFIADLKGDNELQQAVDFDQDFAKCAKQLTAWLDFWSVGNHDDRTLAIVYEASYEH